VDAAEVQSDHLLSLLHPAVRAAIIKAVG